MDLSSYLLNKVVEATTPPNETEAAARTRTDAIVEMVCAFDPRDGMESMIACHCVMLQFLLNAAMRDASNLDLAPAIVAANSARVMGISRTLRQWVGQFDKARKGNETRAKELARTEAALAEPVTQRSPPPKSPEPPVAPLTQPSRSPAIPAALPNGRAVPAAAPPAAVTSALSGTRGPALAGDRAVAT